tara:strand:- start:1237 stop:1569 length:333 start_codon:yes stop_codon:yes gene_type:complete
MAIFDVNYHKKFDDKSRTFFNENHDKSNSEIDDCDFWIEYLSLQLKALNALRLGYKRYLDAKELGIDVNVFPYTGEFTKELVQQSEFDRLAADISYWENVKEKLLNKEVA